MGRPWTWQVAYSALHPRVRLAAPHLLVRQPWAVRSHALRAPCKGARPSMTGYGAIRQRFACSDGLCCPDVCTLCVRVAECFFRSSPVLQLLLLSGARCATCDVVRTAHLKSSPQRLLASMHLTITLPCYLRGVRSGYAVNSTCSRRWTHAWGCSLRTRSRSAGRRRTHSPRTPIRH